MTTSLVRADTFIRATRDTGYRSTAWAIAELIDNAIQASATHVDILVSKECSGDDAGLTVAVVDDGVGMTPEQLGQALQFGGSSRFNNREGQGRFGMGLPNASLSQARKVDVYSWDDSTRPYKTCLDSDAVSSGVVSELPAAIQEPLPHFVQEISSARGTAVIWTKCDRIPYQRPGMLTRHLHRELGRIFRAYIDSHLDIRLNGVKVQAIDPIRIRPSPTKHGVVSVLPPLILPFALNGNIASEVRVTFAVLPVAQWADLSNEEKRAFGITGSGPVSILRAGREIALGWYLMGAKRRENYDDWWRCEVAFEPALDEWFGVSHSKQGIRPTPSLIAAISPSLEEQGRSLNRLVRDQFANLKQRQSTAVARAKLAHHKLILGTENATTSFRTASRAERIVSPGYSIEQRPSDSSAFLTARRRLDKLIMSLNTNHPFYHHVYAVLTNEADRPLRQSMDLFLLSLGRVLASADQQDRASWDRLISAWSDTAALLLEER